MATIPLLFGFFLSALCYAQSSSSSSNAATVTVTSVSTLAIVILPSSSTLSSSTLYSYSSTSSSGYVSSTLTAAPSLTSTTWALQTVPYTGQAMLVSSTLCGSAGQLLTLKTRWAHVTSHSILLCHSQMALCSRFRSLVVPTIDQIAAHHWLSHRRMPANLK
jgi:hypothetical protein